MVQSKNTKNKANTSGRPIKIADWSRGLQISWVFQNTPKIWIGWFGRKLTNLILKFAALCFKQRRTGQHSVNVKVFACHLNCIPTLTIKTFAMIRADCIIVLHWKVGQNTARRWATGAAPETGDPKHSIQGYLTKATQDWYDEVTEYSFDPSNIDPFRW